jgi:hypothetical protein
MSAGHLKQALSRNGRLKAKCVRDATNGIARQRCYGDVAVCEQCLRLHRRPKIIEVEPLRSEDY